MASGGKRTDLTRANGFELTSGEDLEFVFTIKDSAGANVTDMSGWSAELYLLYSLDDANGQPEASSNALASDASPTISAPTITAAIPDTDTVDLRPRMYAYELWRTDGTTVRRLAYGLLELGD